MLGVYAIVFLWALKLIIELFKSSSSLSPKIVLRLFGKKLSWVFDKLSFKNLSVSTFRSMRLLLEESKPEPHCWPWCMELRDICLARGANLLLPRISIPKYALRDIFWPPYSLFGSWYVNYIFLCIIREQGVLYLLIIYGLPELFAVPLMYAGLLRKLALVVC